jgi:hypothetical protein
MKNKNPLTKDLLEQRVIFKNSDARDTFFSELKEKFGTWKNLRIHFKIYKSRLENFRNGSISLPYKQFLEFLRYTDKKHSKEIILKDKNWGLVKAGKVTYEKHKDIFERGRKIAAENQTHKVNKDIKLSSELCELIGAFIGDGFMNKYNSRYILQITGNAILDIEYYKKTLIPIIKKISPESNPSLKSKENTLRLNIYSKGIYELFNQRFQMKNGKKVYVIMIPREIINSRNSKLINSCLRGIFDTDGCVAFDKRKAYKKPYIRIILHIKSLNLIKQVYYILRQQNINATITKDGETIQINGIIECKKFIHKIGFSNPRHLNKIKNL